MRNLLFILIIGLTFSSQAQNHTRVLGGKSYEVSNHLGNIMAVVSDRKIPILETTNIAYTETDIKSFNDYYPYGMLLENRNDSKGYRFGFQGQEKDDEVKGENNSINYKYRVHDPRLGRFFAVDPLGAKYPYYSQYAFSGNRVIDRIELEGLETSVYFVGGRGALAITGSYKIGIMYDHSTKQVVSFRTWTIGVGPEAGIAGGIGGGFYPTASIDDLKGHGLSAFYNFKIIGGVEATFDINLPKKYKDVKAGVTGSIGPGLIVGGGVEYTNTKVEEEVSWVGAIKLMKENSIEPPTKEFFDLKIDDTVKEVQRLQRKRKKIEIKYDGYYKGLMNILESDSWLILPGSSKEHIQKYYRDALDELYNEKKKIEKSELKKMNIINDLINAKGDL